MEKKNRNFSVVLRKEYKGYMEPLLLTGCEIEVEKMNKRRVKKITRSQYIRYAVINQLIKDGYPLKDITSKFNAFYKGVS